MKYATYQYSTEIRFSAPVSSHFFLLRFTPSRTAFQHILSERCAVSPQSPLCRSADAFGNIVHTGSIIEPHDSFAIESSGELKLEDVYAVRDENLNRLYLYESPLTQFEANLRALHKDSKKEGEAAGKAVLNMCEAVGAALEYTPGTTNVATTAAAALALGKGVCQDFAHILIALCRLSGIPARYAAGFTEGEGASHAWVEYFDDGYWRAADPTHRTLVETGFIKLAHGRDFEDCALERGVFSGLAQQTLQTQLSVGMRDFY